jgi:hypothetical protein
MPLADFFGLFSKSEPAPPVRPSDITHDYILRNAKEKAGKPDVEISEERKELLDAAAFVVSVMNQQEGFEASVKKLGFFSKDKIFVGFCLEDKDITMTFDCYLYLTKEKDIVLAPVIGDPNNFVFSKPEGRKKFYDRFVEFYSEHLVKKAEKDAIEEYFNKCYKERAPRAVSPVARFRRTPK